MGQNIFPSQVTRAHNDNLKCLVSSDQQSENPNVITQLS